MSEPAKISNVGPKPKQWDGSTQFDVFKLELVLHFKAIGLPKNSWGNAALTFLTYAPRTAFLSRLAAQQGRQFDLQTVEDLEVTWEQFTSIMTELYAQRCTNGELWELIDEHTARGSSGPDTLEYVQVLD